MALPSLSRMAYFYPRPPRGGRPDVPAVCPSIFTISIHALREEGDSCGAYHQSVRHYFYPRPPRGGRLQTVTSTGKAFQFLSTPSARRATARRFAGQSPDRIYFPALRVVGDPGFEQLLHDLHHFYPRPPRGGRRRPWAGESCRCDFYPRPPRGGRLGGQSAPIMQGLFLSTPSARRATCRVTAFARP